MMVATELYPFVSDVCMGFLITSKLSPFVNDVGNDYCALVQNVTGVLGNDILPHYFHSQCGDCIVINLIYIE